MTILVTGASGNVGGHLVRALSERHENVRVFDRHAAGSLQQALDGADRLFLACGNVPEQVDFECAAIDAASAAGVRRVVKLSGPDADMLTRSTRTIVNQVAALKRMVDAFSQYARTPEPAMRELDLNALVREVLTLYESLGWQRDNVYFGYYKPVAA